MLYATYLLLSLLLPASAHCQANNNKPAKDVDPPSQIHIMQMDEDAPMDQVEAPGVQVHRLADPSPNPEMLPQDERDRLIHKLNLEEATADWDALEKNLLFLRAERESVEELRARYNGISASTLRALREEIRFYREAMARVRP